MGWSIPDSLLCVETDAYSYKLAIYMDSGLSFDASSEVFGGDDLTLAAGGGRTRRTRRYIYRGPHLRKPLFSRKNNCEPFFPEARKKSEEPHNKIHI